MVVFRLSVATHALSLGTVYTLILLCIGAVISAVLHRSCAGDVVVCPSGTPLTTLVRITYACA